MSDIKVRVGQQNAVKVISSLSGSNTNSFISESVIGGIASVTQLSVSGITTLGIASATNLTAQQLNVYGIAAVGSLNIGTTQVISSARQLQNIASLDATTTATIESAIQNAPNTFTDLQVSGLSTFIGVSDFKSDVYVDGSITIAQNSNLGTFSAGNGNITGILTISQYIDYGLYNNYGVAYFNTEGIITSTQSTDNAIDYTNYILTTDNSGIPIWSNAIDGGSY
jgi:hypothetical protein